MKLAALLLVGASAALGQGLNGIWTGAFPGRENQPQDIAFQFKQSGAALTGKLYGEFQSAPILDGKVTGTDVVFVVVAQEQTGNQISETRMRFTGTLRGGELELTRSREGMTNAGNAGSFQVRNDTKLTFRLKPLGN
jgi:hypothetical protein